MSVLIAGGGLAGAAAAILLARDGCAVTLLERDTGPRHKMCGEFLSREALHYLAALGIDVAALGAAPIGAMRLVCGDTTLATRLPFEGAGLSRLALDEALLRQAERAGAALRRGVSLLPLRPGEAGRLGRLWPLETSGGNTVTADTLFLATGKHDLRGSPRTPVRAPEPLIGFKMHFGLSAQQSAALQGHVEIILFEDGYAGLQHVEGGAANLCLLIDRARYDAAGQDWPTLLASLAGSSDHLARRLDGAIAMLDRPLSIFRVPYGYVHRGGEQPGVYRLGDQMAVIPSFCGDGMSIALHSAHRAVQTLRRGDDAAAYHRRMRRDVSGPVRLAFGLYRLSRSPAMRSVLVAACRRWPGLMRAVAVRTRVPDAALVGTAAGGNG